VAESDKQAVQADQGSSVPWLLLARHYSPVITLFGVWVIWQASLLREGPGYAAVGPRTFPMVVGVGIVLSGLALMWERVKHPQGANRADSEDPFAEAEGPVDWRTLIQVAVLLAAYVALYTLLGFVIASALFLPACAWGLGSRSPVRDTLSGILVALVTYLVFTRLLGLELPGGPIDEPLRALSNLGKPPIGAE
jgi:putative tricarboxylic transport membrane protein